MSEQTVTVNTIDVLPDEMDYPIYAPPVGLNVAKESLSIAPYNLSSFNGGSTMKFEIPCNQPERFADFSNLYVACDIYCSHATATASFGHSGTFGLVNRVIVGTNSNKTFCDISAKNVLDTALLNKHSNTDWLTKTGSILFLTADGDSVALSANQSAAEYRILIPLHNIGIDEMMFPLCGTENLRIQVELASALTSLRGSAAIANTDITINNVFLHYDVAQLSPTQYNAMLSHHKGIFNLHVDSWMSQDAIIQAADTTAGFTLGFSKREAKRLILTQRNTSHTTDSTKNSFSMDCGSGTDSLTGDLTISLKNNGKEVRTQVLKKYGGTLKGPEVLAESLKSQRGSIFDFNTAGAMTRAQYDEIQVAADANSEATSSRFFAEIDLTNGLESEGKTKQGLNVAVGNFAVSLTRTATAENRQLNIFMEYNNLLSLDMRAGQGGVWTVLN